MLACLHTQAHEVLLGCDGLNPVLHHISSFNCNIFCLAISYTSSTFFISTVCPGSSDPPEKIFIIFASENEGYTSY